MMKNNFDELIPINFDGDMHTGGDLDGLSEYKKFEIEEKGKKIKEQATNLVTSLLKVYFDTDMIDENAHLSAIASLETSNLMGLIESARYSRHAVSTLMRKIDAGMHADLSVYPILIELQKSALDIQMKVANYSRTLSPYLKSLKEDIQENDNQTIEILSRVESDGMDEDVEDDDSNGNFRGTYEMNQFIQNKMEEIQKKKEERALKVKEELENKDYTKFENVVDSKTSEEEE